MVDQHDAGEHLGQESSGDEPGAPGQDKADGPGRSSPIPPAGPHADPSLINPAATHGAGSLPSAEPGAETDPGTD